MSARNFALVLSVSALGVAVYFALRGMGQAQAAVLPGGWLGGGAGEGQGGAFEADLFGLPAPLAGADEGAATAEAEGFAADTVLDALLPVAYRVQNFFFSATGQRMEISLAGIAEIGRHEGLRLRPYQDVAGYWTIGYGHKLKTGEWWDDITLEKARELLVADAGTAEDAVNSLVRVTLTQPMFDALVSLAYNIGVGAFRRSTLLRLLNADDYAGAQQQFSVWNKARIGGTLQVSSGLASRRAQEAMLFAQGGLPGGVA